MSWLRGYDSAKGGVRNLGYILKICEHCEQMNDFNGLSANIGQIKNEHCEQMNVFNNLAQQNTKAAYIITCQARRNSKNWYQMLVEH